MKQNVWLMTAGMLDAAAALLHVGCIIGGPPWYRFFGAGERFARLAENGSYLPAIVTSGIAATLGIWACYAFSGAGLLPRLTLLRPTLILISAIYLVRALALPVMLAKMPDRTTRFLVVSSVIVLVLALVHAIGIAYFRRA